MNARNDVCSLSLLHAKKLATAMLGQLIITTSTRAAHANGRLLAAHGCCDCVPCVQVRVHDVCYSLAAHQAAASACVCS